MKPYIDYAITNNRRNFIKSFETKKEMFNFIKKHNIGDKVKTTLLFWGEHKATITKNIYLQKRIVSNGGIEIIKEIKVKLINKNIFNNGKSNKITTSKKCN